MALARFLLGGAYELKLYRQRWVHQMIADLENAS